jgi:hypothetical protein
VLPVGAAPTCDSMNAPGCWKRIAVGSSEAQQLRLQYNWVNIVEEAGPPEFGPGALISVGEYVSEGLIRCRYVYERG